MDIADSKIKIIIAFFLFCAQIVTNGYLAKLDERITNPTPMAEKWEPSVFQLLSFGQLMSAMDWVFLKALTDTSTNKVQPGTHSSLYYNMDLITELDPLYSEMYSISGNLLTVLQGDGPGARDILLRGYQFIHEQLEDYPASFKAEYWPTPCMIPFLLGYTYLFHLDDMPHASEMFQQASVCPNSPAYLGHLSARLKQPGGEYEVGLKLLAFMQMTTRDERVRKKLEQKRHDLFVSQYLDELNQSFIKFLGLQPSYNSKNHLTSEQMEKFFRAFARANQVPKVDPWGGSIFVDSLGKIASSTRHEMVFGLR